MLCILYLNAVGVLLCLLGTVGERLLPVGRSRRWLWCATIVTSVVLPGFYRYHHAHAVDGLVPMRDGLVRELAALDDMIGGAWLLVTAALVGHAVVQAIYLGRLVHRARRERRIVDGVPVDVTDALGPATIGVLRPRVLLPRWVLGLPAADRAYIVHHEAEHRRTHDATLLCLAALPAILFPWNLPLWWQLRRLHDAVEMDCDRRVVARLGDPRAYGRVLLSVASGVVPGPRLQLGLLGRGMLERRLATLLAPSTASPRMRAALVSVAIVLALVVLLAPHPLLPAPHGDAAAHSSTLIHTP